jgi:hypothetical protein
MLAKGSSVIGRTLVQVWKDKRSSSDFRLLVTFGSLWTHFEVTFVGVRVAAAF